MPPRLCSSAVHRAGATPGSGRFRRGQGAPDAAPPHLLPYLLFLICVFLFPPISLPKGKSWAQFLAALGGLGPGRAAAGFDSRFFPVLGAVPFSPSTLVFPQVAFFQRKGLLPVVVSHTPHFPQRAPMLGMKSEGRNLGEPRRFSSWGDLPGQPSFPGCSVLPPGSWSRPRL